MSGDSPDEIRKSVKTYIMVFGALAALTVITVTVGYMSLPFVGAIVAALAIASLKGTLVGGFFMHLFHEKKVIFWVLLIAIPLFVPLLLLPVLTQHENPAKSNAPPSREIVAPGHEGAEEKGGEHAKPAEKAEAAKEKAPSKPAEEGAK